MCFLFTPSAYPFYTVSFILFDKCDCFEWLRLGCVLRHVSEGLPWVLLALGDEVPAPLTVMFTVSLRGLIL